MRKRKPKKIFFILLIAAGAFALLCAGIFSLMNARDFQMAGRIVAGADTDAKKIALTFDDGPSEYTDEILAMLDELNVKCTFFLTGEAIESNMEAAKKIAAAGHQIGNHSYSHKRMVFRSEQWIANEIDRTNALIREAGYEGTICFRPPYGKKLLLLPLALAQRDMTTVTWNIEITDCDTADEVTHEVTQKAQPGGIILLHIMYSSRELEREAVPGIVRSLREQGYELVTINQLLSSES